MNNGSTACTGKKRFDWGILSGHRQELYGLSIIGIMILHYFEDIDKVYIQAPQVLRILASLWCRLIGSMGVDIFIFLSGVGLYYSLKRERSMRAYCVNRIKRVVFPYLLFGTAYWILVDIVLLRTTFNRFVSDLLLITFWTEGEKHFWFITFLLFCYLVYPLIFKALYGGSRGHVRKKECVMIFVLSAGVLMVSLMFVEWYSLTEIALSRILVFSLGCCAGALVYEKACVRNLLLVTGGCGMRILFLAAKAAGGGMPSSVNRYPFNRWVISWAAIGVMFLFAYLLDTIKFGRLKEFLALTGKYSLELYLTHISVRKIFHMSGIETYDPLIYCAAMLLSVLLSIALKRLNEKLCAVFGKGIIGDNGRTSG